MKSLRRGKKGVSTILAQVLMVLIVIILATTVLLGFSTGFWQSIGLTREPEDIREAYLESFSLVKGVFLPTSSGNITADIGSGPSAGEYDRVCTSSSPIDTTYNGDVLVPVNELCIITARVTGHVFADQGSTLRISTDISGHIEANRASEVSISNSDISSHVTLYKVTTVIISNSDITGQLDIRGSEYVSLSDSDFHGGAIFKGNTGVVITGNEIFGGNEFTGNGWCSSAGNTFQGGSTGTCDDKFTTHIFNRGPIPVRIRTIYIDNKLVPGVFWKLVSGAPMQCGAVVQSGFCSLLPVVIPPGETAEVSPAYAPLAGTDIKTVSPHMIMVTRRNFVEGRIHFTGGLTMISHSRIFPRICPCL